MANSLVFDLGIIIIVAAVLSFLAQKLKQPLIPAYIITGLLIGPGIKWITEKTAIFYLIGYTGTSALAHNGELIMFLSEIGIAFLLFIVGLEIDFKQLKDVELVSSVGALLHILVLFPLGYFLAQFLGFTQVESAYMGIVIVFSSTMIVLKILSDRKELDTLHGRIIIALLLLQDALAIFSLFAFSVLGKGSLLFFAGSMFKGIFMLVVSVWLGKLCLPRIFKFSAKSTELLFLTSLGVFFIYAFLFEAAGFSLTIGAFVAGLTLGNLSYNVEIIARVKPLRDFFAIVFFVSLGMQLYFLDFSKLIIPFFVFFIVIMFIKPFMIMLTTAVFGYKKRTSFLTGISLGQLSEFALIIVAQGVAVGYLSSSILSLTIMLTVVTITLTSYLVKYQEKFYQHLAPDLAIFEYRQPPILEYQQKKARPSYLLCGCNRVGYSVLHKLLKLKEKFIVIDFNPQVIKELAAKRIPCLYGDIGNPEVMEHIYLKNLKLVISTITHAQTSLMLVDTIKKVNRKISIFVTAATIDEALVLYQHGADYVILPHFLGGDHVSLMLEKMNTGTAKLLKTRNQHLEELVARKKLGNHLM